MKTDDVVKINIYNCQQCKGPGPFAEYEGGYYCILCLVATVYDRDNQINEMSEKMVESNSKSKYNFKKLDEVIEKAKKDVAKSKTKKTKGGE
jgi:hypothetical protein